MTIVTKTVLIIRLFNHSSISFQGLAKLLMDNNNGTVPLFVYFSKEPPARRQDVLYKSNLKLSTLFNVTYHYRADAVISLPFVKFVPRDFDGKDQSFKNLRSFQEHSLGIWQFAPNRNKSSTLNRDISYKTKDILWMVSHCTTDSHREDYVEKLQRELSTLAIDIFGKCGKHQLPKSNLGGEKPGIATISMSKTFLRNF